MRLFVEEPYILHRNFVNRQREREEITAWWSNSAAPIKIVNAFGGFGKSALAWVWLHFDLLGRPLDVACERTPLSETAKAKGVFWWSFYSERDKFRDCLTSMMRFLCSDRGQPRHPNERLRMVTERLASEPYLLVLDGLERLLIAYEEPSSSHRSDDVEAWGPIRASREYTSFSDPLAGRFFRALTSSGSCTKVLCTTRLIPNELRSEQIKSEVVAGVELLELSGLDEEAALHFFKSNGIACHRGDMRRVCAPIDYHPLYLRLMVGYLSSLPPDFRGDFSSVIAFNPKDDLRSKRFHVLQRSYEILSADLKAVLDSLSVFRTGVDFSTLKSLRSSSGGERNLLNQLLELERRGFVFANQRTRRYDMHPIVRAYVYSHMSTSQREITHTEALFGLSRLDPAIANALKITGTRKKPRSVADHFTGLVNKQTVDDSDLKRIPRISELYYQLIGARKFNEALNVYRERLSNLLFFRFGSYYQSIAMLEELVPAKSGHWMLKRNEDRIWVLNAVAMCYSRAGLIQRSRVLYERALSICRACGATQSHAVILQNISEDLLCQGFLRQSSDAILESRRMGMDERNNAVVGLSYRLRGYILAITSQPDAMEELQHALVIFRKRKMLHPELYVHTNMAWAAILEGQLEFAFECLAKADRISSKLKYQRDIARISFLRGKANRVLHRQDEAVLELQQAHRICKEIGLVEFEANILNELAHSTLIGSPDRRAATDAVAFLRKALAITRRSGFALQEADSHLLLAKVSIMFKCSFDEEADNLRFRSKTFKDTARREAHRTMELCSLDGAPHLYRSAYDEASQILKETAPQNRGHASRGTAESKTASPLYRTVKADANVEADSDGRSLWIVHLSDLHLNADSDPESHAIPLVHDLRIELKVPRVDYLVISGDITDRATQKEFAIASKFFRLLKERLGLRNEQLLVVPGNHDVQWDTGESAYRFVPTNKVDSDIDKTRVIELEKGILSREEGSYRKRFQNFRSFLSRTIEDGSYSLAYDKQFTLRFGDDVLFLGLNSAWECDGYFPNRCGINQKALLSALMKLPSPEADGRVRIAVWHHPVAAVEHRDHEGLLEILGSHGFRVWLHGHAHRAERNLYEFDGRHHIHRIGAGTFGVHRRSLMPAIPWQYNVINIDVDTKTCIVRTRRKEKELGSWMADSRWGDRVASQKIRNSF